MIDYHTHMEMTWKFDATAGGNFHGVNIMAKRIKRATRNVAVTTTALIIDQWVITSPDAPMPDIKRDGSSARLHGRFSGLRATNYQNRTLEMNRIDQRTDAEMAANWTREFPISDVVTGHAGSFPVGHVNGQRGTYNRGSSGKPAPSHPVPQWKLSDPSDPSSPRIGTIKIRVDDKLVTRPYDPANDTMLVR
jgi:hypothetical protein